MDTARDIRSRTQPRRGLRRNEAAIYVGVSVATFDKWVADGAMPEPKRRGGVAIWDVSQLDIFFESLPSDEPAAAPSDGGWGKS
ncbi:MAG TPA: hypothetical protein VK630_15900 [Reyranella sp.]|nr:hypothetical protein [Reyranella sp.]